MIGLIKDDDEPAYKEEVAVWCDENNLLLNTNKTKEVTVDFRMNADAHTPIQMSRAAAERVTSFKFLAIHILQDLT